jgi:hypothetical protein
LCQITHFHVIAFSESGLKLLRAKDLDDAAKQAVAGVLQAVFGSNHATHVLCLLAAIKN